MEIALTDRQMNVLANKVASIVVRKLRNERIDEPRMVSCKEAAAMIGSSADWLRRNKHHFTYIKRGENKQSNLYFDANKLLVEFTNK